MELFRNKLSKKNMKKTIVITGSSTGIGRATALYFLKQGWQVAATMRHPENETELQQFYGCKLYALDVANEVSVQKAVADILHDFSRIDVVLNNAGYGLAGIFESASQTQIQQQFATNVFGLMCVTKAFLPHFRANRAGLFINISSIGGLTTTPTASLYHAAKWAVEGFSEALLYELSPLGIGVKLVEPGRTSSDFAGRSQVRTEHPVPDDYLETMSRIKANMQKAWSSNLLSSSESVAVLIYQAATDGTDQIRYLAGDDAKERYAHRLQEGDVASVNRMKKQFIG